MNALYSASRNGSHLKHISENETLECPIRDEDNTMADDSDTEDAFQDATEKISVATEMDLITAIEEASVVLHLFFNNKHKEAMERMKPWANRSIYHALGYGGLHCIQAFMTFDPAEIDAAVEVLKQAAELCHRRRHKTTLTNNIVTKMVARPNYNSYTEEEVHAELCYAECLLMRALVTFIQDDNLLSFIKGGLRLRSCFQSYKECDDMLVFRQWNNEALRKHFESGVCMGIGTFNLLISTLPPRILRLLEFIGFSGNREIGCSKLDEGQKMYRYLRGPMCSIIVILYHIAIRYGLGNGSKHLDYVGTVLEPMLQSHPNGTLLQFCTGRYENTRGNVNKAVYWLEKSLQADVEWEKFKHLSHWEMTWTRMLQGEWKQAVPHVDLLYRENKWSKATYYYMKGAQLMLCEDITLEEQKEIIKIMRTVPGLKVRISGKSIPLEKFFCKKAEKFIAQNNWLFLPGYEMMYVWNYFMLLQGKTDVLTSIIARIDREMDCLREKKDWKYFGDNYYLGVFLKGLCLKYMNSPLSAEECFKEVLNNAKNLKDDTYLISCACLELGFICIETKNYTVALQYLEESKRERTFFTEFRVHQGMEDLEALTKKRGKNGVILGPRLSPSRRTVSEGDQYGNGLLL